MNSTLGIYVHIPFCVKKCPYCDFNSIEAAHVPDELYVDALLKELSCHINEMSGLQSRSIDTIYIGGGTPSLLSPRALQGLLTGTGNIVGTVSSQEITLEVNPGTVNREKLALFKEAGINRLSIGLQSFNDRMLDRLGRIHTARNSFQCFEDARRAGFHNIGIDLICAIPGQTTEQWKGDLEKASSLRPEHVSTYSLTIEPKTPFFHLQQKGGLLLPPEEEQIRLMEITMDMLGSAGYGHYEISNFSLPGFESRHNMGYWSSKDYIGLGAGAHSYLSSPHWGTRWWNEPDPSLYLKRIKEAGGAVEGREELTHEEAMREGIFLGLRKTEGIDTEAFLKRFNFPLSEFSAPRIRALKENGLLSEDVNRLKLTRKGIFLSNEVFAEMMG